MDEYLSEIWSLCALWLLLFLDQQTIGYAKFINQSDLGYGNKKSAVQIDQTAR